MNIIKKFTANVLLLTVFVGTGFTQITEVKDAPHWGTVKRQIMAVKYNENKQTTVTMAGTSVAPRVNGKADVEYKQGRTNVRLEMDSFANPQALGAFYTTYVLWAVAPEGQTENLMELPIQKKFKIESTTKFQTFGLMITAEPHARVELPSSMIVAENFLRKDTRGAISTSSVDYNGDPGVFYNLSTSNTSAMSADYNTPLMILGARRAVEIAQRANANKFANEELRDAEQKLATLEQAWPRSRKESDLRDNAKKNSGLAHDVMRIAEQARKLSVERNEQAQLSNERQQAGDNIAQAQSDANRAQAAADRAKMEANLAHADASVARTEAERAQAAERAGAVTAANDVAAARLRVEQAKSETEKAQLNEGLAREEAGNARLQTEEARRERDAAQQKLYLSLSAILETRREARGMIVSLSDVLFDTGKATLKSGAREKLSKLSGILAAYSGTYQMEIEGHTDSVGSEESNLNLSRGRAASVREYLVQNGVKSELMMASQGFGESKPVASNDTASGRQVNRRVEIIIEDRLGKQSKVGSQ